MYWGGHPFSTELDGQSSLSMQNILSTTRTCKKPLKEEDSEQLSHKNVQGMPNAKYGISYLWLRHRTKISKSVLIFALTRSLSEIKKIDGSDMISLFAFNFIWKQLVLVGSC